MTNERLYSIYYKTKDRAVKAGFEPMTFKEALIVRPKCISAGMHRKYRSVEIRRVC
jgi:hypothetical protein